MEPLSVTARVADLRIAVTLTWNPVDPAAVHAVLDGVPWQLGRWALMCFLGCADDDRGGEGDVRGWATGIPRDGWLHLELRGPDVSDPVEVVLPRGPVGRWLTSTYDAVSVEEEDAAISAALDEWLEGHR